jgi:alkyldihydroxyacetonephosphate synthase
MRRSFWGWGHEEAHLDPAAMAELASMVAPLVGADELRAILPPTIDEVVLPRPRLVPPPSIADRFTDDPDERAGHTYGKSFRDVVRALDRDFTRPPDLVALPRDEHDVVSIMDWCASAGAIAIPYGGGSSVVGGVEAPRDDDRPVVSIDLRRLTGVVEIDHESRAARIAGGTLGPALEDDLRPHGLTLRHYPQSFEFSTLGGWLVTRSGGHYATLHTHIDDFVESIRAVTPIGLWESRRLPGSGAGPSPDRLLVGSEGTLGIVTEAWMRLQDRPSFRASGVGRFATFEEGLAAARVLAQSGLWPTNCRLVDSTEALVTSAGDGTAHLLLIGFESADHPVDHEMNRAVELVRDLGGDMQLRIARSPEPGKGDDASDRWRSAFLRAPYLRDALVCLGLVNETFETAITWDRAESFVADVRASTRSALERVGAWPGIVTCRVTHVYPDGCAPYFTVIAAGDPPRRLAQWHEVKESLMAVIGDLGGTVTHHHAVGRDHRAGYDAQRPDPFAAALVAAKAAVDPGAILNPGVLVDPRR